MSPYLTLNLGLRWDYEDQTYVKHDWQNFGPRVHFAWDATQGRQDLRARRLRDLLRPGLPERAADRRALRARPVHFRDHLLPGISRPARSSPRGGHPGGESPSERVDRWIPTPRPRTRTSAASASSASSARTWPSASISSTPAATTCSTSGTPMRRTSGAYRTPTPACVTARTRRSAPRRSPRPRASPSTRPSRSGSRGGSPTVFRPSSPTTCRATGATPTAARPFRATTTTRARTGVRALNDIRHILNAAVNWTGPWGILLGASGTFLSGAPYNITTGADDNGDGNQTERPPGVAHNSGRGAFELDDQRAARQGDPHRQRPDPGCRRGVQPLQPHQSRRLFRRRGNAAIRATHPKRRHPRPRAALRAVRSEARFLGRRAPAKVTPEGYSRVHRNGPPAGGPSEV